MKHNREYLFIDSFKCTFIFKVNMKRISTYFADIVNPILYNKINEALLKSGLRKR